MTTIEQLLTATTRTFNPLARAYNPSPAVRAALQLAHQRGRIEANGPWVPAHLDLPSELLPMGGSWPDLITQATAGLFFTIDNHGFYPAMTLLEFDALTESEVRIRLLHGLTKNLAPPAVAAGLFVVLGIHPLWGLRLVQHSTPFCKNVPLDSPTDFEDELILLQTLVFGSLNLVFGILRKLDPQTVFPETHFEALMGCCLKVALNSVVPPLGGNLPLLIVDHRENIRPEILAIITSDLLGPLIATGVIDYTPEGYRVHPETLEGLEIGDLKTIEAQDALFEFFVTPTRTQDA